MVQTENFIVRFHHYYVPTEHLNKNGDREQQPVATKALIYDRDKVLLAEGIARCSKHDLFEKEIGRKISLLRAVDDLNVDEDWIDLKDVRKEILSAYFNRKHK